MKIALLQLLPGNPLEKGIDACKKAKEMGADVALFPEMWSSGYAIDPALALPADGAFVKAFQALAEKLEMAIGVTASGELVKKEILFIPVPVGVKVGAAVDLYSYTGVGVDAYAYALCPRNQACAFAFQNKL